MCIALAGSSQHYAFAAVCPRVEPLPERRWYVAWHPDEPHAILRSKTVAGFRQWRKRRWQRFDRHPPIIIDVTATMGGALAELAFPNGRPPARWLQPVLVLSDEGPEVAVRIEDAPPLPGEVATVDGFHQAASDLRGGARVIRGAASRDGRPVV